VMTFDEICGPNAWRGGCTHADCPVCRDSKSPIYRRTACPTRTLEDKIVEAGEDRDYLGQRAEILKLREDAKRHTEKVLAEIEQAKKEGEW